MLTLDDFNKLLHSSFAYEQRIISIIDPQGQQIHLDGLSNLFSYTPCTIKVEQMENFSQTIKDYCSFLSTKYRHTGPITCHAFRAFKKSVSFGAHTDPDNVLIHCVWGTKTIKVDGNMHNIEAGNNLLIPANTLHEALNIEESLMLSFGFEKFYNERIDCGLDDLS